MSQYTVSARKYRPQNFETLIGQDNIATTLKNSILRGKLAHAYLFCGPRGVGKTTTARIFAKMINCSNPGKDMEPCGECESCLSFAENRSYCIHELDAASNNGVDEMKALIDKVRIPPQVGKYSVYIIDEVHMLSTAAFNAFLKTLEEPPAHAIFILATTEKHKILPTILSRCQTYDFNRITVGNIVKNLRMIATEEGITVDDESLHVIAQKADGAMRDALTIFDQSVAFCGTDIKYEDVLKNLNVLSYEHCFTLVDNFLSGNYRDALLKFDEILAKGFNSLHFVSALSSHLRDLVVSKTAGMDSLLELPDSLKQRYRQQAERCPLKFLYDALAITTGCESGFKAAVNPRLHIEFALMRLCFITVPVPGAQAGISAPAQTQATAPATTAPAPAKVPVAEPVKAPAPEEKEAVREEAPAREEAVRNTGGEPARRPRRSGAAVFSANTILNRDKADEVVADSAQRDEIPSNEEIMEKWKELPAELAKQANRGRLASAVASAKVNIERRDDKVVLTFLVSNQAQVDWIRANVLHSLESDLQTRLSSRKVEIAVDMIPLSEEERTIYTPDAKYAAMAKDNPELGKLVTELDGYLK